MSIEIANIKKSFGRTQVLNDISLDIPPGKPRCCASLPGWRISPAGTFVFTVPTSAGCTLATVKLALFFSTMRCFVI